MRTRSVSESLNPLEQTPSCISRVFAWFPADSCMQLEWPSSLDAYGGHANTDTESRPPHHLCGLRSAWPPTRGSRVLCAGKQGELCPFSPLSGPSAGQSPGARSLLLGSASWSESGLWLPSHVTNPGVRRTHLRGRDRGQWGQKAQIAPHKPGQHPTCFCLMLADVFADRRVGPP